MSNDEGLPPFPAFPVLDPDLFEGELNTISGQYPPLATNEAAVEGQPTERLLKVKFRSKGLQGRFDAYVASVPILDLGHVLRERALEKRSRGEVVLSSVNPTKSEEENVPVDSKKSRKAKKWIVGGLKGTSHGEGVYSCLLVNFTDESTYEYYPRFGQDGLQFDEQTAYFAWVPGQCKSDGVGGWDIKHEPAAGKKTADRLEAAPKHRRMDDPKGHSSAEFGGRPADEASCFVPGSVEGTAGVKRPQEELDDDRQRSKLRRPERTLSAMDGGGPAVEAGPAGDTQRHILQQRAAQFKREALQFRLQAAKAEAEQINAELAAQGVAVKESAVYPPFRGSASSFDDLMMPNDSGNSSGGSANSSVSGDILLTIDTTGECPGNSPWHEIMAEKKVFINTKLAQLFELSLHQNSDTAPEITVAETRDLHDNPVFEIKLECEMEFPDGAKTQLKASRLIERIKQFLLHGIEEKKHHYIIMWNGREGSVILMLSAPQVVLDAALKRLGQFNDEFGCAIDRIEPVFRVSVRGVARDAVVRLLRAAGSRTAHVSASGVFACNLFASEGFADRHVWLREPSSEQQILDPGGVYDEPIVAVLPTPGDLEREVPQPDLLGHALQPGLRTNTVGPIPGLSAVTCLPIPAVGSSVAASVFDIDPKFLREVDDDPKELQVQRLPPQSLQRPVDAAPLTVSFHPPPPHTPLFPTSTVELEQKLKKQDEEMRSLRESMETHVTKLRSELEKSKRLCAHLEKREESMETHVTKLRSELEESKRQCAHLEKREESMETHVTKLRSELEESKMQCAHLEKREESMETHVTKLRSELEESKMQCAHLEKRDETMETHVTKLRSELEESKRQCAHLEKREESMETHVTKLRSELEEYKMQCAHLEKLQHYASQREKGQPSLGNSYLTNLGRHHKGWILGGIAELLHNAVDANAKKIKITECVDEFGNDQKSIKIDDDGIGIGHGLPACGTRKATGMHRMMQIGSDTMYGKNAERAGQVGGYGVGAKFGIIAIAHTGIILTLGETSISGELKTTLSIGIMSDQPYHMHNEKPIFDFVTLSTTFEAIKGVSTEEQKAKVYKNICAACGPEFLQRIRESDGDMAAVESWIQNWRFSKRLSSDKKGTTVFLIGLRVKEGDQIDADAKGTSGRLVMELEPASDPKDIVLYSHEEDGTRRHFSSRQDRSVHKVKWGKVPRADYSLRALCEIIFHVHASPVKEKLEISLFGEIVNRTNFGSDLCKVQRRHVNGIPVLLGCQKPAAQYECGVNVYCEGTMIMPFTLRELSIDDPGDFGATMVIDFPKDVGVIPGPTKVSYNFNGIKEKVLFGGVKNVFEEYIDILQREEDQRYPYRKLYLADINWFQGKLADWAAEPGWWDDAGAIIGVRYLPPRESSTADEDTYYTFTKSPMSLKELKEKVKKTSYYDKGNFKEQFGADLRQIFDNAIAWHSRGRWIADTCTRLNPNNCTYEDQCGSKTNQVVVHKRPKGQSTNDKCEKCGGAESPICGKYTIREILRAYFGNKRGGEEAANAFEESVVEQNKENYAGLTPKKDLEYGTSLLIPHRVDQTAVKLGFRLIRDMKSKLQNHEYKLKAAQAEAKNNPVEFWLQCADCNQWRKFPSDIYDKYGKQDKVFKCTFEGRSCNQPDDDDGAAEVIPSTSELQDSGDDVDETTEDIDEPGFFVPPPEPVSKNAYPTHESGLDVPPDWKAKMKKVRELKFKKLDVPSTPLKFHKSQKVAGKQLCMRITDLFSDFELEEFNDVKFMLQLPNSNHLFNQSVRRLQGLLGSEELKKLLLSPEVRGSKLGDFCSAGEIPNMVNKNNTADVQKTRSDTWVKAVKENPRTLFLLVLDEAHYEATQNGAVDQFINQGEIRNAKNVVTVFVSATPYNALTKSSQIPVDNVIQFDPPVNYRGYRSFKNNMYDNDTNPCDVPRGAICKASKEFKVEVEDQKEKYLTKHKGSPKSRATQVALLKRITKEYTEAMVPAFLSLLPSSPKGKSESESMTGRMMRELFECESPGEDGIMILVRQPFATGRQIFDSIIQARNSLGLAERFAVLLDLDESTSETMGQTALGKLMEEHNKEIYEKLGRPTIKTYQDLNAIPCILILCEKGKMGDTFPESLRFYDLRMRYATTWSRTAAEQDIGRGFRHIQKSDDELPIIVVGHRLFDVLKDNRFLEMPPDHMMKKVEGTRTTVQNEFDIEPFRKNFEPQPKHFDHGRATDPTWSNNPRRFLLHGLPQVGKTGAFLYAWMRLWFFIRMHKDFTIDEPKSVKKVPTGQPSEATHDKSKIGQPSRTHKRLLTPEIPYDDGREDITNKKPKLQHGAAKEKLTDKFAGCKDYCFVKTNTTMSRDNFLDSHNNSSKESPPGGRSGKVQKLNTSVMDGIKPVNIHTPGGLKPE